MRILILLILFSSFMFSDEIPSVSIKEIKNIFKIQKEIKFYSLEDQASAYALGWTETEWDYYAKHSSDAEGICGVMPLWNPYLKELNIKPNSLEACIAIFNFYKEQTGSTPKAIKEYKGVESKKHMWIVFHTLYIRQYILKKLKEKE